MSIRIESTVTDWGDYTDHSVIIECDDRLPSEEIKPWMETYEKLAGDLTPTLQAQLERARRAKYETAHEAELLT